MEAVVPEVSTGTEAEESAAAVPTFAEVDGEKLLQTMPGRDERPLDGGLVVEADVAEW